MAEHFKIGTQTSWSSDPVCSELQWLNDWFLQAWTHEDTERPVYKKVQMAESDQNQKKLEKQKQKKSESLGWDPPPFQRV